jgi:hypothetical protein
MTSTTFMNARPFGAERIGVLAPVQRVGATRLLTALTPVFRYAETLTAGCFDHMRQITHLDHHPVAYRLPSAYSLSHVRARSFSAWIDAPKPG